MKTKYILASFALAGFMTSCYDLDTEPMSSTITESQRDEITELDPAKILGLSDGIYKYYNEFEWFSGNYYDFGYPSIMLQMDSRTADFISVRADRYGWFSDCAEYTDNTSTNGYNYVRWGFGYGVIFAANQMIAAIPESEQNDPYYKYLLGQAYGHRAFAYWFLAQVYQFNYAYGDNKDKMCVPLITEKNQAEVAQKGAPRASVAKIYEQILNDLNTGIALMTNNPEAVRVDKRYIDINVLYGLRARTYLCMQDYPNAAADAQKVIDSREFTPLSSQAAIGPGFNNINDQNWIWGIYYYMEDATGLYTWPGFMGSYTYGYAYAGMAKCITDRLFNDISTSDPRRQWWLSPAYTSNADTYTSAIVDSSWRAAGITSAADFVTSYFPVYANTKIAPYENMIGQSDNQGDVPLMRIEEMYYILAEALGQGAQGSAAGVQALENFVNDYRWTNKTRPYSFSQVQAQTGRSFIEEIFWQREVEFWGEGMTYFDILRLNMPIYRSGTNWTNTQYQMDSYAFDIDPGDPILLYQIPQSEIDNNPALTPADQNETGSVY